MHRLVVSAYANNCVTCTIFIEDYFYEHIVLFIFTFSINFSKIRLKNQNEIGELWHSKRGRKGKKNLWGFPIHFTHLCDHLIIRLVVDPSTCVHNHLHLSGNQWYYLHTKEILYVFEMVNLLSTIKRVPSVSPFALFISSAAAIEIGIQCGSLTAKIVETYRGGLQNVSKLD